MKQNPLLIVMLFLVVILTSLVGAGGYMVYQNGLMNPNMQSNEAPTEQTVDKYGVPYSELYNASVDDIVLNITNARGRLKLMKISCTMKSVDENIEEIIKNNKDEIIDVMISQVGQRTSEELLTIGGKELLREELIVEFNDVINALAQSNEDIQSNNIKEVLFTTFVMK